MNTRQQNVINLLKQNKLVKAIAGINNFDIESVKTIVNAATKANVAAIDIAADVNIVNAARELTHLPLFVSSVEPQALASGINAGADIAEIGNFDALYAQGLYLTAQDIINLTQETQRILPEGTPLSVTVPGHLSPEAQIALARQLEQLGVTMIQTEGASRVVALNRTVEVLEGEQKVALTLQNTQALVNAVNTPVLTASGLNADNVALAINAGAAGVGIGSAVNKLTNEADMVSVLSAIVNVVNATQAPQIALVS